MAKRVDVGGCTGGLWGEDVGRVSPSLAGYGSQGGDTSFRVGTSSRQQLINALASRVRALSGELADVRGELHAVRSDHVLEMAELHHFIDRQISLSALRCWRDCFGVQHDALTCYHEPEVWPPVAAAASVDDVLAALGATNGVPPRDPPPDGGSLAMHSALLTPAGRLSAGAGHCAFFRRAPRVGS